MDVVFIDEREDVQKKTFTKWINSQLVKCNHSPINDLFKDLHDGSRLLALLEVLTGRQFKQEKGRMRVHHINNVNKALQILQQNNVKLVNISSNDIVDGNPKLTLGLVWSIILHWQVHYHLKDLMSELQQTNLEKTLLAWCRLNCADYTGVDIRNFTTSWSDGLAFNALLHKFRPELFDYDSISRKLPHARLEHAFRMAEKNLGIDRLLDPEDVNTSVPDKKSIMTYVMCLFQSLPHEGLADASIDFTQSPLASPVSEVPSEGIIPGALRSRPLSLATNVSVELGGYQVALEEVLTWLLEAEDKLTSSSVTPGDLDNVKQQFYAHEEFLLELSGHQEGVGAVLEEGARMLSEGGLSQEEEDEVRVQMKLLNSRWEELRVNAMEKQTRIHEILMKQQQKELENLRVWLTGTEDRISRLSGDCGMDLPALLDEVSRLKQDLQNQQKVVDALANLVVVVDETTGDSDTAYSHMEDQLSALGERWAHVCQWAEEKGNRLGSLLTLRDRMRREAKWLQGWMDEKEVALKLMEADPVAEKGAVLQRVKQLQILRHQINAQQNRLARLQEIVQEIDAEVNSSESAKEAIQIETLADRWEALVQITDVQAQRIADSGLECNLSLELAIVPREEPPPSPTTSSPMVDQRKRRRMKNSQQTEIESSCEEINSWLEETEEYLHSTGLNAASINQIESVVQEKQKVIVKLDDLVSQLLQEQELPVEEKEMVAKLKRRLNNVEEILSNFACKEKSEPYKQYEASKSEFIKWISEAENLLRSDESIVLEIPELRKQLQQIKDIQEGLAQHENEFREVKLCGNILMENAGGNVAIQVQTELSDLEKRWTELLANIGERVQNIEAYIVRVENMASDISTMEAWLDEVNSLIFVNVDESVGNLEASATRVLESKAVLDNIAEMKENEIKIEDSMKKLMSDSFKTSFTVKLMEQALALHDRWNMTESAAKQHNERMEQLHENNKTVLTGIEELSAWLDDLEESLSPSNTEIVNAKVRYQQLKQNIHDKSQLFRTINDLGNSMVAKSEGGDLRQKLTQLNTRWNEMTNDVFEKHKALQSASEQYGEFRALVAKEKDWLDKLEKLLIKKSPNTAADAEELSEELDDLENFIRNHSENSIARIQDIGQHLMSNQVVTDNIETEINNISDRFTSLSKKAQDRAQVLEVCVAEAQECESHVNVLQSWLENVNIQLTERLQNDLTADDLPQDVQRLSEEFEVYTKKLLEIEEKVCLYEEAGKQEASTRLKEQLSLVNEKFKSVSEKFEQFKSPEKYALKLHRALRELRSIEEAVCLLELTSDDPEDIQGQLNHCMRFYNTLSDVKSEIELVLQEGRKAVEEGRTENPEELTKHLDDLKDLYNKLGVQVSESKNCLETALELSKVLHEELPALLAWVHGLEQELDQVESTPVSHRYLDAEYSFIKETLEVDCEKWGQVKDNVRAKFRQFSSLCSDPVYLEVLRDRVSDCVRKWDRIKERLIEAKEQLEVTKSSSAPANATTQRSSNNEEPYEKKQRENLSSVDSDIREFSLNTDEMLKRMNEMLVTIQGLNDEQDPGKRLEVLEREVSSIAPDAASLISRGDGLVLAVHSKNPALGLHLTNTSLDSLRAKWSQLMSEVELRKLQAQQAEKMIKEKSELLLVIKEWLKKMNQELELANNDENKLKLLCKDFESKEKEVDRLKEINSELQIQQINDKLMISDTIKSWDSFQQKLQSLHKNTTIKNLKQMEKTNEKAEVISKINRTREEISQISRRLNSRSFRCYDNHAAPQQEAAFKAIKEEISKCKPQVEELDQDHKKLDGCGEQAKRVAAKLKDEWSHLNKNFSDKYRQWQSAHMAWEDLQRDCKVIEDWLSGAETQVKSWSSPTTNILLDMGVRVTDLEKQLIGKRRVISTLNELLSSAGVIDAKNRLSGLQERWQQLYEIVLKYKSKLSVMESSQQCLDHVNALLDTNANPSDDTSLSVRLSMVKAREEEVALKKEELELVKAKETGEQALNIDSTLTVLTKAGAKLAEHREYILCKLSSLKKLISRIDNVSSWVASIKARVSLSHSLHDAEKKKMQESISACVKDCETEVKEVLENVINLEKECQGAKQPISSQLKEKVKKLREDWMFVKSGGDPKFSSPEPIYSSTSKGAGAWIDSSSRNVESTTATASPSPPRAILLATFDKSILQIRDWLTLEEEMLKQQSVTVGDVPAILQVLDKQKNVLRELEQKKPQLDELVHTAENLRADSNRQQLHGKVFRNDSALLHLREIIKVTKLREHWDEANNAVVQRKATLDAMLSDSQRYDSKRQEVEAWLNRMETRLDRMPPVGHTADVLDTQIREQKSFHAEVHQYKSNIDILSKLTQQLVAVYQQDDTSRVKKTTEQINMRYNNLNSSIVKRGELLHSAINSLHNLDRSLDKFLAWLSETESALETVETDPEKQATHLKVSPKSSILNL
ncbi:dystrophin, isoforms A/C/F/G/H isoform X4 [Bemisia tabaci]|uniref:dystrophin, isoforms A/C/F/G/H isoform X4 n=1 Tax=Bemisia tabaci TaxID=7038 RepID=UPI003B280C4D